MGKIKANTTVEGCQKTSGKYHRALERINPSAAFVDIGSGEHWVCIPEDCCNENVRRYDAYTSNLYEIRRMSKREWNHFSSDGINRCVLDCIVSNTGRREY